MPGIHPYIVGPAIERPEHFYGRGNEVRQFFSLLRALQLHSMQVIGLRRSGKTSFLKYVSHPKVLEREFAGCPPLIAALVDLQAEIRTPSDFYSAVARSICRSPRLPERHDPPGVLSDRAAFDRWLQSPWLEGYRFVILLDEFEALKDTEAFDTHFFWSLRSLVGDKFAWVTASFRDLYRLSQKLGNSDPTSPFFNVFHPAPIVMGTLTDSEALDLIHRPLVPYNIKLSAMACRAIQDLAGKQPFFLQAVADQWVQSDYRGWSIRKIKQDVAHHLYQQLSRHFRPCWDHLSESERHCLSFVAEDRLPAKAVSAFHDINDIKEDFEELTKYGLLEAQNGRTRILGSMFSEWVRRQGRPSPPMGDGQTPAVSGHRVKTNRSDFRAKLRQKLTDHFNEEELQTLCFDMGLDYDSLEGQGKAGKAREFLAKVERDGTITRLLEMCRRLRPRVLWPDIPGMDGGVTTDLNDSALGRL
ncbi:MAG: ATP-binding protein [Chloroflexi bacterium]|nr:ATP-binding protein [Chloroflexota bacterium]